MANHGFIFKWRTLVVLVFLSAFLSGLAQAANPKDWWVSVSNDRAETVRQMLARGADPNEISPAGQPALMQAIRDGAWAVYEVLLEDRATVLNAINVNRETALMYLAVLGETGRAEDLIRRGAMVNRKGWTPLHYAASKAHLETAGMLLRHGAQVNARAADGTTPLMMAAYGGSEPMVRLLLEHGADSRLKTNQDYDAADWAGFKAHTHLQAKLHDLVQRLESGQTDAALTRPAPSARQQAENMAAGTGRYFDLERFERDAGKSMQ